MVFDSTVEGTPFYCLYLFFIFRLTGTLYRNSRQAGHAPYTKLMRRRGSRARRRENRRRTVGTGTRLHRPVDSYANYVDPTP